MSNPVPLDPLLAGLRLPERDLIARTAEEGIVALRYVAEGCDVQLRVLADCHPRGTYTYRPAKARNHQVLRREQDLLKRLPLAGSVAQRALAARGALRLDEDVAGKLEVAERRSRYDGLFGSGCEQVTHVAVAIELGGSALSAGAADVLNAKASLFDERTRNTDGVTILEQVGDVRSCGKANRRGEKTPGCDVPLRVWLSPLEPAPQPASVATAPRTPAPIARAPAPPVPERAGASGERVAILAGEFSMGADGKDKSEAPKHKVYLDAFRIDRTEVTSKQYASCVAHGACTPPKTGGACTSGVSGKETHPINCVTWTQAKAYCAFVKGRLPSEAEWERAARGADGREFVWGAEWPPPSGAGNFSDATARATHPSWLSIARYDDGYPETAPVGAFPAGRAPSGALDMAGNVWEWTADWYGARYYQRSPAKNPKGPPSGEGRVVRGGSFGHHHRKHVTVTARAVYREDVASEHIGFRCAEN